MKSFGYGVRCIDKTEFFVVLWWWTDNFFCFSVLTILLGAES